ncbi:Stress responsive alpha-beta barrel domain-containing protein [Thermobacillus xylanilyticus]|jgi:hypothetical protein|uniref:Stress responsive alpha-beta barrel domain-containing protein n=1 Tax=Thermobacillus xylanilyticus TaxID=76633 RepID=A0ABN7RTH9_THEXY|nr:Dabb family protein [Thermobacillus xylanilyticus]CAG5085805.1 Stress responsive alpha-beta barrel domain-containing protein [Thermobacillus xylanilyticus]
MTLENGAIRHMAIFTLKYPKDAPETEQFLEDGRRILTGIPVVRNFEVLRQTSPKTDFDFGFSMEFASQADYDAYNAHPDHVKFVEERWKKEVVRFQEIDFVNV